MDTGTAEAAIKLLIFRHSHQAEGGRANRQSRASNAEAGSIPEAIRVSMDLDQYIYDAGRLHDAVTLLGRSAAD